MPGIVILKAGQRKKLMDKIDENEKPEKVTEMIIPKECPECHANLVLCILPTVLYFGRLGVECPICKFTILFH